MNRAEILRIEPNLTTVPDRALHVAGEGMVEPVAATLALLAAAQDLGAALLVKTPIKWLVESEGRVSGVMTE